MIDLLIIAFLCATSASCYHHILSSKNHVFARFRSRLDKWDHAIRDRWGVGKAWDAYQFITRSLVACSYCLAGQIGVVAYVCTSAIPHGWAVVAYVVKLGIFTATTIYLEPWTGKLLRDQLGRSRQGQA